VELTEDHRLTNPGERQRLQDMGIQLASNARRLYGLNLCRGLGDKFLKDEDLGARPPPHTHCTRLHTRDMAACMLTCLLPHAFAPGHDCAWPSCTCPAVLLAAPSRLASWLVMGCGAAAVAGASCHPAVTLRRDPGLCPPARLPVAAPAGLSAEPYVSPVVRLSEEQGGILLIASDGLWDVADADAVTAAICQADRDKDGNVLESTNAVIAHALKQRTKDDVTALVVRVWPASEWVLRSPTKNLDDGQAAAFVS
jgi:serine/threonine protein phosphatase PrpC